MGFKKRKRFGNKLYHLIRAGKKRSLTASAKRSRKSGFNARVVSKKGKHALYMREPPRRKKTGVGEKMADGIIAAMTGVDLGKPFRKKRRKKMSGKKR